MSLTFDLARRLPREIFLETLSYLDEKELAVCGLVSKTWNEFASDKGIWRNLVIRHFHILNNYVQTDAKKHYIKLNEYYLKSDAAIIKCIQYFINRVLIGERCKFVCYNYPNYWVFNAIVINVNTTGKEAAPYNYSHVYTSINSIDTNFPEKEVKKPDNGMRNSEFPTTYVNPSLTTNLSNPNQLKSFSIFTQPDTVFVADLDFPRSTRADSPMELAIVEIITKKLGELRAQKLLSDSTSIFKKFFDKLF